VWTENPWLTPLAVAPLFLIHRSLAVPQLQAEARVDPKTGLSNAGHLAAVLDEELGRATRFERPLSLLMVDLDLLREINNSYGHLAGDAVLCGIADIFRRQLRRYDVAARFGGEEFLIMLPATPQAEGLLIAERIRAAVADQPYAVEDGEPLRATISIGVASFPEDGGDAEALLRAADRGVYVAKAAGRNRVDVASPE
jgi:diguanylate cyclase (GGDEF)-like protein